MLTPNPPLSLFMKENCVFYKDGDVSVGVVKDLKITRRKLVILNVQFNVKMLKFTAQQVGGVRARVADPSDLPLQNVK